MAFKLRPSRGETALSFYNSTLVSAEAVQLRSPASDWGVAAVTAGALRDLGFNVTNDGVAGDRLSEAHVSARPPVLTPEGQLPLELSRAIARLAYWVLRPGT